MDTYIRSGVYGKLPSLPYTPGKGTLIPPSISINIYIQITKLYSSPDHDVSFPQMVQELWNKLAPMFRALLWGIEYTSTTVSQVRELQTKLLFSSLL